MSLTSITHADNVYGVNAPPAPKLLNIIPANIPAELKALDCWVIWKAVPKGNGKSTKPPVNPKTGFNFQGIYTADGRKDYVDFQTACIAQMDFGMDNPEIAGVGLVILKQFGYGAIDCDDCIAEDGTLDADVAQLLEETDTYAEFSPSSKGVRLVFRVPPEGGIQTQKDNKRHVYTNEHYVTMTGHALPGADGKPRPVRVVPQAVLERYAMAWGGASAASTGGCELPRPELVDYLPDRTVLEGLGLADELVRVVCCEVDAETALDLVGKGDTSAAMLSLANSLFNVGLEPGAVLGLLEVCPLADRYFASRGPDHLWNYTVGKAWSDRVRQRSVEVFEGFDVGGLDAYLVSVGAVAGSKVPARDTGRFVFKNVMDITQTFVPTDYFIKGVLERVQFGMIYGASGSGKSFMAIDMCMSIARGEPWRGLRVRQGNVGYVCAEGYGGFQQRLMAFRRRHGLPDDAVVPFAVLDARPDLYNSDKDADELIPVLQGHGFDLIVIDTLAQVSAGVDENSSQVAEVLVRCQRIADKTGAMVLLIHHTGKDETRGARGWSGMKAPLDVQFYVYREDDRQPGRILRVVKLKDGEEGAEFPFHVEGELIGVDQDLENVYRGVVVHDDHTVNQAAVTQGQTGTVLRDLLNRLNAGGHYPSERMLISEGQNLTPSISEKKVKEFVKSECVRIPKPDGVNKQHGKDYLVLKGSEFSVTECDESSHREVF